MTPDTSSLTPANALSAETRFIAACCRWPHDAAAKAAVRDAISGIVDWSAVLHACRRHRVLGFVHRALQHQSDVPQDFMAQVKFGAQKIAVYAERQASEAVRLQQHMLQSGIPSVQFKGPSLSQLAYGALNIKRSKDLDILVSATDVRATIARLEEMDYRIEDVRYPIKPALSDALIRHRNQIELVNPQDMIVEVHWQLASAPGLLPDIEKELSTQQVTLGSYGTLKTLGDIDLFIYLCQHGALHDWARLRWLVDVAALFFSKGPDITDALMQAAHERGAGVAAQQAQLLCHLLFDTPAPRQKSQRAAQLSAYALRQIEAPYTRHSVWEKLRFNAVQWWMQRHFYPNSIAALGLLKVHRASLDDITAMPLSARWDWLYLIMRLPRWLGRAFSGMRSVPKK